MPMAKRTTVDATRDDETRLLRELDALHQDLCARAGDACGVAKADEALAVFRMLPGLDLDTWDELAEERGLHTWLTLPLNGDAYPHLKRLQDTLLRLAREAQRDPLTGLANRRAFETALDLEIERAKRDRTPVSLAILDLDDFKQVNDTYGHPAGDEVLVRLARLMTANKRRYDVAARIGGEEFAVVLCGSGQLKAERMVLRLLDELRGTSFTPPGAKPFTVTASAGLASYKGSVDIDVPSLVELADKALYAAKAAGKDAVHRAPLPDVAVLPDETLVHASEKRLLFGK